MGLAIIISLFIIIADQISKYIILEHLMIGERIWVIDQFFSIFHIRNSGAAWGFLAEKAWGINILTIISIVASILVVILIFNNQFKNFQLIMALILGGSVGNLIDRVRFGNVVDFLSLKFGNYYFPTFNIADSAIVVGGILLVLYLLKNQDVLDQLVFFEKHNPKEETEKSS